MVVEDLTIFLSLYFEHYHSTEKRFKMIIVLSQFETIIILNSLKQDVRSFVILFNLL